MKVHIVNIYPNIVFHDIYILRQLLPSFINRKYLCYAKKEPISVPGMTIIYKQFFFEGFNVVFNKYLELQVVNDI